MRILVHKLWVLCGCGLRTFSDFISFGMMFRTAFVMAWLGMTLLWVGCRSTGEQIRWYPGSPRSTNEVGLVIVPHNYLNGPSALILGVDGTKISKKPGQNSSRNFPLGLNPARIELLPGQHTLELAYFDGDIYSVGNILISFNCEAGHAYYLYMAPIQNNVDYPEKWGFFRGKSGYLATWIVDAQTSLVVAGHRLSKYYIVSSGVTRLNTAENANRASTTTFKLQDRVRFYLALQINDPIKELPKGDVVFKLYSGSKLIADLGEEPYSYTMNRDMTTIYFERPASYFGVGHYRLQVLCQGDETASQLFEITP